jgi:hypothetical protein
VPPAGPSRGRPGKVLLVFEDSGAGAKEVGLGWGLVCFAEGLVAGLLVFEDSTPNTRKDVGVKRHTHVTHVTRHTHVTHTSRAQYASA